MVEARYAHYLIFADGFWTLMFQYRTVKIGDEEWREVWFNPTPELIEHYGIKETEYVTLPNVTKVLIKKTYKASWFKPLNLTPGKENWFILCNYHGEYVSPTELFGIKDYEAKLEVYKKEIVSKELIIMHQQQEIRELSERPDSAKKKMMKEMQEIKDIVGPQLGMPPPTRCEEG